MKEGFQFLEDIATAAWYGEVLFTAVEKDLFSFTKEEHTATEIAAYTDFHPEATQRFLLALSAIKLLRATENGFINTDLAETFLIPQNPFYQGHSVLWRKDLCRRWTNLPQALICGRRTDFPIGDDQKTIEGRFQKYSLAMDDIAHCKGAEITKCCPVPVSRCRILDLGSGLGAISRSFLERYSDATATFGDMSEVIELCEEMLPASLLSRIHLCSFNILEQWDAMQEETFDLIILSNIVHAFDFQDNLLLLQHAAEHLSDRGIILIHDFIREHHPAKAAIFDLNMLLNTYNGHVFSQKEIQELLCENHLCYTDLIPLPSDTALILAAKSENTLSLWKQKGAES